VAYAPIDPPLGVGRRLWTRSRERRVFPGWVPFGFALLAVALLPWIVVLARTLPARVVSHHWDLAWIGFDLGLMGLLGATAWATWKRRAWLQGVSTATATMLAVDAWFDVVTSAPGRGRIEAVVLASVCELPLALACLLLAQRAVRRGGLISRINAQVGAADADL
jgi:hypothetical protein